MQVLGRLDALTSICRCRGLSTNRFFDAERATVISSRKYIRIEGFHYRSMVLCRVSSYWNLLTYDRIKDISTKGGNNPWNSRSFMVDRVVGKVLLASMASSCLVDR